MNRNRAKAGLERGNAQIGGWIMSGSPVIAEAMAPQFDWIAVDMEHGAISKRQAQECIRAITIGGSEPFMRLYGDLYVGLFLDMGATGIIFPKIETAEQAQKAVSSCLYPPRGNRSFALSRCTLYGQKKAAYFKNANDSVLIAIMIESVKGVQNLQEILDVPGIDAVLIGPYDLSGSLGCPGDFTSDAFELAVTTIEDHCRRMGVPFGIHDPHGGAKELGLHLETGKKFVAIGMDTVTVTRGLRAPQETQHGQKEG